MAKVICGWCPPDQKVTPGAIRMPSGICADCAEEFMSYRPDVGVELEMRETSSGPLPETTVRVCGRELVFLGRPGPLLRQAVEQVRKDAAQRLKVSRMAPSDVRD